MKNDDVSPQPTKAKGGSHRNEQSTAAEAGYFMHRQGDHYEHMPCPNERMNISLNPSPVALVESLRNIGYTLDTALADIIDNSITAKAGRISVRYLWEDGVPWIAICDDGNGLALDELIEAMRLGSRNPKDFRSADDLGRFGLGLKTASISQCRRLTVISRKGNSIAACDWDLDALSATSTEWHVRTLDTNEIKADRLLDELTSKFLGRRAHGTIVLWRGIEGFARNDDGESEARFSAQMDFARKHLELVFHRFLSPPPGQKKLVIDFNDTELEAFDPFGSSVPARQELTAEKIRFQGEAILVQPYVLPHHSKAASVAEYQKLGGEEGYLHNQGFYVYRNHRLIIKATWFRLIPKDELNKLLRIKIDIPNSLDHLWRIDIKKSQASPPEPVRKELRRIIQKISGSGRTVFTNRASRILNRQVTPVWKREIVQGKIRYSVNEEHPIVKGLIIELSDTKVQCLRACFDLINSTFPYDLYYADAANDHVEFDNSKPDEDQIRAVGIQLVRALRSCGFAGEKLEQQIRRAEFFICSPQLMDELLSSEGDLHE